MNYIEKFISKPINVTVTAKYLSYISKELVFKTTRNILNLPLGIVSPHTTLKVILQYW